MHYRLYVPPQAVGASLIYFDLWNPSTSGQVIEVKAVQVLMTGINVVSGVISVELYLNRTSAIGTGGTAAVQNGATLTAMTFTGMNTQQPLELITARLTPSGGATAGALFTMRSVFPEETGAGGTYVPAVDMARNGYADVPPILVRPASGMSVVQGATASVGTIGFDVIFKVRPA